MDTNGNLMIIYIGRDLIRLYSCQPKTNVNAIIQDDGNFIFKEASSSGILWQNFDSSTNTFLPGMKLGINHKTGKK